MVKNNLICMSLIHYSSLLSLPNLMSVRVRVRVRVSVKGLRG
jgi:hypothetical protein